MCAPSHCRSDNHVFRGPCPSLLCGAGVAARRGGVCVQPIGGSLLSLSFLFISSSRISNINIINRISVIINIRGPVLGLLPNFKLMEIKGNA